MLFNWLRRWQKHQEITLRSRTERRRRKGKRRTNCHLRLEPLEDRTLMSGDPLSNPAWQDQGPNPIINAQSSSLPNNDQAGAVETVAAAPITTSSGTTYLVYAGTVNGGIWRAGTIGPVDANGNITWSDTVTPGMLTTVSPPSGGFTTQDSPEGIKWHPLTDNQPSLAISAMTLSTRDAPGKTIWAGTGTQSSSTGEGGPAVGLLMSSNYGQTWKNLGNKELGGSPILGIALADVATGTGTIETPIVASMGKGILYSPDGGATFKNGTIVDSGGNPIVDSGGNPIPLIGNASDVVADPNTTGRFYAAIVSTKNDGTLIADTTGIFRSDDNGKTWTKIDSSLLQLALQSPSDWTRLSVHNDNGTTVLYAAVSEAATNNVAGVFRTDIQTDGSANWYFGGVPATLSTQYKHFALEADPVDANIVYLSGYGGAPIWRGNFSNVTTLLSTPATWTMLSGYAAFGYKDGDTTIVGAGPHADSRDLAFLPHTTMLMETDDGGIFGLDNPAGLGTTGYSERWVSLNSNLHDIEAQSAQYDPATGQIFAGAQDNGTSIGSSAESWQLMGEGDGSQTALGGDGSHYYYQDGQLFRDGALVNLAATPGGDFGSGLSNDADKMQFYAVPGPPHDLGVPIAASPAKTQRIMIGHTNIYESDDRGDTITNVTPSLFQGVTTAIAYGKDNSDAAYVDTTEGQLWVRSNPGSSFQLVQGVVQNGTSTGSNGSSTLVDTSQTWSVGQWDGMQVQITSGKGAGQFNTISTNGSDNLIVGQPWTVIPDNTSTYAIYTSIPGIWSPVGVNVQAITVDPNDYHYAYFVLTNHQVWETTNAGAAGSWHELDGTGPGSLSSLTPYRVTSLALETFSDIPAGQGTLIVGGFGGVYQLDNSTGSWSHLGSTFPNVVVNDVHFIPSGAYTQRSMVLAATYGRGVWTLPVGPEMSIALDGSVNIYGDGEGDSLLLRVDPNNPNYDEIWQGETSGSTPPTGAHNETYTYDKEGNRTMTGYVTSTGNRLTSDGTYSYTYDSDGNMLTQTRISDGQVTSYTWDFRNRLTEVLIKTSGGTTVQDDKFTYDIENSRIGKSTLSGGQSWTAYVDQNPYADFNSSGSLTYWHLYGVTIDSLLGRVDSSGNAVWYLTDKLGSVRENVDGNGNVLDSITYDTFGNIIAETHPTSGDRFKYTSREWDSEIGQYFYRARYYSPTDGRFESEDPSGFGAGDLDLYRYVKNEVTGATDPRGLQQPKPPTILTTKEDIINWAHEGYVSGLLVVWDDQEFQIRVRYDTWNGRECDPDGEKHFDAIFGANPWQSFKWTSKSGVPFIDSRMPGVLTPGPEHKNMFGEKVHCRRVDWLIRGIVPQKQLDDELYLQIEINGVPTRELLTVSYGIHYSGWGIPWRSASAYINLWGIGPGGGIIGNPPPPAKPAPWWGSGGEHWISLTK